MKIEKRNIFTCKDVKIAYGLSYILDYLYLKGENCLLFNQAKPINSITEHTYLESWTQIPKIEYNGLNDLLDKATNKSNLFRVDTIAIDLWNYNIVDPKLFKLYKETTQNIIILSKSVPGSILKLSHIDFNTFYIMALDKRNKLEENLIVEDVIRNTTYNFSDFIKMDIRNLKIDKLFD